MIRTDVYEPGDLFDWEGRVVQVLVTTFADGRQALAYRTAPDRSWSAPTHPVDSAKGTA